MAKLLRNPLDLTWIRTQISQYITLKDALACAVICRDWTDDFTRSIWHTVDFDLHKAFPSLDKAIISKYGHFIRVIKNLKDINHLNTIQDPSINRLKSLSITIGTTLRTHSQCHQILHRNNTSLAYIDLFILGPLGNEAGLVFSVDSVFPTGGTNAKSRLTSLKLKGLTLTRDSFSSLLRMCPLLKTLDIRYSILSSSLTSEIFQHSGVTCLASPIKQTFKLDPEFPETPSLFAHFPNLKEWKTWISFASQPEITTQTIRAETTRYCPQLKTVYTELISSQSVDLLIKGFEKLKGVCVLHKNITIEMIMAILSHHGTLENVRTYTSFHKFYDHESVPSVESHFQENGWAIQTLLRLCPHLTVFEFPLHEMDMDQIEEAEWGCNNLEELHIRIRGLDTDEIINKALRLWIDLRNRKKKSGSFEFVLTGNRDKMTLEERVARHLLKFEKLNAVWLGNGIRRVKW
ncbi:hypothetical protein BGX27_000202 [Mortierella sp. AM989]|nr:hypothetical protein BGX27_000202 [Mortierella sp. AM989]